MKDFKVWTGGDKRLNRTVMEWMDSKGMRWCSGDGIFDRAPTETPKYYIYTSIRGLKYGTDRYSYDKQDVEELDIETISRAYDFDESEFLRLL